MGLTLWSSTFLVTSKVTGVLVAERVNRRCHDWLHVGQMYPISSPTVGASS